MIIDTEIDNRFMYHPPQSDQTERYVSIRKKAKELAKYIVQSCKDSRELNLAITKLEEVVFWANAAIARNE